MIASDCAALAYNGGMVKQACYGVLVLIPLLSAPAAAQVHPEKVKQRTEAVARWVERMEAEVEKLPPRSNRSYYLFHAAGHNAAIGRLDRAHAIASKLEDRGRDLAFEHIVGGVAEWDLDDATRATEVLDDPQARSEAMAEIALVLYRRGDAEGALKILGNSRAGSTRDVSYCFIAEWLAWRKQFDRARALLAMVGDSERIRRNRVAGFIRIAEFLEGGLDKLEERARAANIDLTDYNDALARYAEKKAAVGDPAGAEKIAIQIPNAAARIEACVHSAKGYAKANEPAGVRRMLDAAHQAYRQIKGSGLFGSEERLLYSAEADVGDADRAIEYERKENAETAAENAAEPRGFDQVSLSYPLLIEVHFRRGDYAGAIAAGSKVEPIRGESEASTVATKLVEHDRMDELEEWFERTPEPLQRLRICDGALWSLREQLREARGQARNLP